MKYIVGENRLSPANPMPAIEKITDIDIYEVPHTGHESKYTSRDDVHDDRDQPSKH